MPLAIGRVSVVAHARLYPVILGLVRFQLGSISQQDRTCSLSVAEQLPSEVRSLVGTVVVLLGVLVPALVRTRVGVEDVPVVPHRMKKMT